jgi:arylformamidase
MYCDKKGKYVLLDNRGNEMKIYDITKTLDEKIPFVEGDPLFKKEIVREIRNGGFSQYLLSIHSHAGTHMDAPSHVISGGMNIKDIPVEKFVGKCMVCENLNDVMNAIQIGIKKILVKGDFGEEYDAIDFSHIELIGVEAIAIGNLETHMILLRKNIVILEWLALSNVPTGVYFLAALPLKTDTDGAPMRAVLIDTEGEDI